MKELALAALVFVGASALWQEPAVAQVKQVEMDIAGYLCGF